MFICVEKMYAYHKVCSCTCLIYSCCPSPLRECSSALEERLVSCEQEVASSGSRCALLEHQCSHLEASLLAEARYVHVLSMLQCRVGYFSARNCAELHLFEL